MSCSNGFYLTCSKVRRIMLQRDIVIQFLPSSSLGTFTWLARQVNVGHSVWLQQIRVITKKNVKYMMWIWKKLDKGGERGRNKEEEMTTEFLVSWISFSVECILRIVYSYILIIISHVAHGAYRDSLYSVKLSIGVYYKDDVMPSCSDKGDGGWAAASVCGWLSTATLSQSVSWPEEGRSVEVLYCVWFAAGTRIKCLS